MAANILRSERAVQMSLYVIRAFVKLREQLAANAAILKRLAGIDHTLWEHDSALRAIWTKLQPLLAPPPEPPRRRIGFNADNPGPGQHPLSVFSSIAFQFVSVLHLVSVFAP